MYENIQQKQSKTSNHYIVTYIQKHPTTHVVWDISVHIFKLFQDASKPLAKQLDELAPEGGLVLSSILNLWSIHFKTNCGHGSKRSRFQLRNRLLLWQCGWWHPQLGAGTDQTWGSRGDLRCHQPVFRELEPWQSAGSRKLPEAGWTGRHYERLQCDAVTWSPKRCCFFQFVEVHFLYCLATGMVYSRLIISYYLNFRFKTTFQVQISKMFIWYVSANELTRWGTCLQFRAPCANWLGCTTGVTSPSGKTFSRASRDFQKRSRCLVQWYGRLPCHWEGTQKAKRECIMLRYD